MTNILKIARQALLPVFAALIFTSQAQKKTADLLVYNASIYTVDDRFSVKEAMAVREGKVVAVGTNAEISREFDSRAKLDAMGKFVYPGFIDAHAHFLEYGLGLQALNLVGTRSWEECLERVKAFAETHKEGWLLGGGWDQNDWPVKEYPTKEQLDELFPSRPVYLRRVDGHAALANGTALGAIKAGAEVPGGVVETKNGNLTGILVDNAMGLVDSQVPGPGLSQKMDALLTAQSRCFAAGLTTIDDCGLPYDDVLMIEALQKTKQLKMRLYVMLRDEPASYDALLKRGAIKTSRLNVRSFKVYADGALGSRGACLLQPYADKPGNYGFLVNNKEHFETVAARIYAHGFQMCTHAIGDSGNRVVLNAYAKYLGGKNDLRWRIEHAQVVNKGDLSLFGKNSIVPSVQPTHATSDMYWAGDRLGPKRIKEAYAYRQLLDQNGWMPLGTDFPVEDISPVRTFYAACIRKDAKGWPAAGFQVENALTRKDALKGMTLWAAMSNFEEKEKGSLEAGKFADFIILDQDIMKVDAAKILATQVLKTYLNGELVYDKK
jgi:predicted amidohydrolase YtcJ